MLKDNLKKSRTAKGYTQDDVAEFLNVKRQTYSAYERGVSVPDAHTLNKLSEYFGVSASDLLGEIKAPQAELSEKDEFWELRREMAERSEMKTLFSLAKGATKEDLEFANDLLKRLRGGHDD